LALGAVPRTLPIPGLSEHALSFKSLADAINLRNHVLHQLEAADAALDEEERSRRLTFVFVGAGYAGVEALAELSDLTEDALRYYPRLRAARRRWVLVDAASRILPDIPPSPGDCPAARQEPHGATRAVRLPDARPGRHARPAQGHRRGSRPAPARLRRLVGDALLPPVPAPARAAEVPGRRRLDSGALLPPRHCRAR